MFLRTFAEKQKVNDGILPLQLGSGVEESFQSVGLPMVPI